MTEEQYRMFLAILEDLYGDDPAAHWDVVQGLARSMSPREASRFLRSEVQGMSVDDFGDPETLPRILSFVRELK